MIVILLLKSKFPALIIICIFIGGMNKSVPPVNLTIIVGYDDDDDDDDDESDDGDEIQEPTRNDANSATEKDNFKHYNMNSNLLQCVKGNSRFTA